MRNYPQVLTLTVNQWNIKHNVENPDDPKPVLCINQYEFCHVHRDEQNKVVRRVWGKQIGDTEHHYELPILIPGWMTYDPVNKTPCGASCWFEAEVPE